MADGKINTEGLPPWEAIQLKTFLNWANSFITPVNPDLKILDPRTELTDGLRLICLVEALTGESLGRYHKKPKLKPQMFENINLALKMINDACKAKGLRLFYSAEDMMDGNLKLIMGMLWVCISKFMIDFIKEEDLNAKDALLLWVQKKTASYDNVSVPSYKAADFQNGMAFCALLHKHDSSSIDYETLQPQNKHDNLELAIDTAYENYGIPKLIDVDDLRESADAYLDEKTLITYLSFLWKQFASSAKNERVMSHISKICRKERVNRKLMTGYEQRATKLMDWMRKKAEEYRNSDFGTTEEKVYQCQKDVASFKKNAKPTKAAEKGDLETALAYLQTKLITENRPTYSPPGGMSSQDISDRWSDMCKRETKYEDELTRIMIKLRQANQVIGGIVSQANNCQSWINNLLSNDMFAQSSTAANSLSAADAACTQHELYEDAYEKHRIKVGLLQRNLGNVTKYTSGIEPNALTAASSKLKELDSDFQKLRSSLNSRKAALQAEVLNQRALDAQRLEFAKRAEEFMAWVDDTKDELGTPVTCSSLEEANELVSMLESKNEDISGKWFEIDALAALNDQTSVDGSENAMNPYTRFTVPELDSMLQQVLEVANNRQELLEKEIKVQEDYNELRSNFNGLASKYMAWADDVKRRVATSDEQTSDQTEELNYLGTLVEEMDSSGRELLNSCETSNISIVEAGITTSAGDATKDDSSRVFTMAEINGEHELVGRIIREKSELIQEDIVSKNQSAVPEDVLQELEEAFELFDKDKDGVLTESEFKACLQTLDMEFEYVLEKTPEVAAMLEEGGSGVSLEKFQEILGTIYKEQDTYEYAMECFKTLANGKDTITAGDLSSADLDPDDLDFLEEQMASVTAPNAQGGRRRSLKGLAVLDYNQFLTKVYQGDAAADEAEKEALAAANAAAERAFAEEEQQRENERLAREAEERKERELAEEAERKAREEAEEAARKAAEEARIAAEAAKKAAEAAKKAAEEEEAKRKEEEAARIAAEEERKRLEAEALERARLEKERKIAEEKKKQEALLAKRKAGKEGYLYKKGGTKGGMFSRGSWLQRWFVVGEDATLRYYKDKGDAEAKGEILLTDCKAFRLGNHRERLNCVLFELKNGETFFMSADTEMDAEEWLVTIKLYV